MQSSGISNNAIVKDVCFYKKFKKRIMLKYHKKIQMYFW